MYIPRQINILGILKQKSLFLLGPRQTGKTSLIAKQLSEFRVYDLLDNDVYLSLSREPKRLQQDLVPHEKIIINDTAAIEIKAKKSISPRDLRGIIALKEEKKLFHYMVVSMEERPRVVHGVRILPWEDFLKQLWKGAFIKKNR